MVSYVRQDAFERASAHTYNSIEAEPPDRLYEVQQQLLRDQLRYLSEKSIFYRRRFQEHGIDWRDITSIEDLAKVPFTVKQDLRDSLKSAPPFGEHLAASPKDIVQMQASSGTTGSPSYVALTESDVLQWNESSARGLFACGVRPGDRVLHGFSLSRGFVGGMPIFQAIQYMGAVDVPIGADGGADRLLVACRDIRPNAIVGTPNFLLYLGQVAEETIGTPARELGVRRLIVGGEPGGGVPALREQLEETWGAKAAEMMGGTDLGVIYWGECELQRGMHMVSPDFILTELIEPLSGNVIAFSPGARGELVYTALGRQASPVLRFRSGDHVEVIDCQCACGRTGPLIRCVGRTDDMLIVRGVNVFPSAILEIVGELRPRAGGGMRVLADFPGHSTQSNLKLLVERGPQAEPSGDADLKADIERRVRNRLAVKPDVEIVPFDAFERPGAKKVGLIVRDRGHA